MSTTWRMTSLSVSPPSYQMADTDRVALAFAAGQAITTATASIVELPALAPVAGIVESTTVGAEAATIVVSNMTRGKTYELAVTFGRADNTRWTRTLVIECVA
ncbi:MAG: hypothetical protein ACR2OE_02890 [Thermomicrobiales bacterium]